VILPEYIPLGSPRRYKNGSGKQSKFYAQKFRLLRDPSRRVRSVTLKTTDSTTARRRAVEYVERRISEIEFRNNPAIRIASSAIKNVLDEYIQNLGDVGNTAKQTLLVRTRIEHVISEAGWTEYQQVDAVTAVAAISSLRKREVITTVTTANKYREAVRAWSRWMKKNGRWPVNVLEDMPKIKGDTSPSRRRAILTDQQFNTLLTKTRTGPSRRNLTGEQRVWLYLIASQTGLRAQELHSLTPSHFHLGRRRKIQGIRRPRPFAVTGSQRESKEESKKWSRRQRRSLAL
jgi:integrase